MTDPTSKDTRTAWERWELASFDAPAQPKGPAPAPGEQPQEPPIHLPTAAELEQIHQQARDEGYRLGYAEGQAQAKAEAERLAALVTRLDGALAELDQDVGEELVALAVEIARRVVDQSVAVRPEIILAVVRRALAELPHLHAAVHLNPEDAELVRTQLGDQFAHAGHRVYEDASLPRGICLIDGGGSQGGASLATRWRRVLEALGAPADWIEAKSGDAP